jgi:hypothetical protein
MTNTENRSEVTRLMQQITAANEAAYQALYGLAQGAAQHAFITVRLEHMGACHEQLIALVGQQEADLLLCQALDDSTEASKPERTTASP